MHNSFILVLALGSGMIAFLMSFQIVNSKKQASTAIMVVGPMHDIEIGTMIKKEDLDLVPAPENINTKLLFTDFGPVENKVARRNLLKGEAIKSIDLLAEGENPASLIPAGYRAMTIPVILPSNLTKLIQVGNRLDVLLTFETERGEFESVTLVKNAKVIGLSDPVKATGPGASQGGSQVFITLAVTPQGAETLAYSMKKGTLNVSVYSLSESGKSEEKFFTLKELFSKEDKAAEGLEARPAIEGVEIIRGLRKEKFHFDS
jgi:Flp pilus assembly protein CpaB